MTDERLAEIKHSYENACGVAYEYWDYSQGYPPVKAFDFEATEDMLELITEVERLDGENERLSAVKYRLNTELEHTRKIAEGAKHNLAQAEEEIARLRKALEFYADENTYKIVSKSGPFWIGTNEVTDDNGETAREALGNGD